MDDERYLPAFGLIMNAGNSKSCSMMAIEASRNFEFDKAKEYLLEAERELSEAHQRQTEIIQQEAMGNPVELNIILVHAQDHLMTSMTVKDLAIEIIDIHEKLELIKK